MVGAPHFLSRATFRPFGPRVVATAIATESTPRFNLARASSENINCFAIIYDLQLAIILLSAVSQRQRPEHQILLG